MKFKLSRDSTSTSGTRKAVPQQPKLCTDKGVADKPLFSHEEQLLNTSAPSEYNENFEFILSWLKR